MNNLSAKEKDLLQRLVDKPSLQPYFFNKADDIKWISPLREKGFFSPESVPKPEFSDENGYFIVKQWSPASYLSNIKEQLKKKKNRKHAEEVWKIIKDVTRHAKKEEFGNYHVWWRFAEIMRFIPLDIITVGDIKELVGYWLSDRFDSYYTLQELGKLHFSFL